VARRIKEGHPWVFEDALRGRKLSVPAGAAIDLLDQQGDFIARAVHDPGGPLVMRTFSRTREAKLDASQVRRAIASAADWRRRQLSIGPDTCERVLNGDSEGVPAVNVDRYGDYLIIAFYSAIGERIQDHLVNALRDVWNPRGIYLQRRDLPAPPDRPRPPGELVYGAAPEGELTVREGKCRFMVDVTAPLGTGLFPDMRLGRNAVARLSAGVRVLNCFSYTAAFSVVAGVHGAAQIVSVDSAERAHARARQNFKVNGLDYEAQRYEWLTADTFAALARMESRGRRFDLVILDPPTFSTTKGRTFTALKDYAELVSAALAVVERGGTLLAASNAARLTVDDFDRAIGRGADLAGKQIVITERLGQPPDYPVSPGFPEGRYLKVALVQVIAERSTASSNRR
jgi:23S rRNA (cytosine1962-C5)-methyltransferase